jgi:hypothetical protein
LIKKAFYGANFLGAKTKTLDLSRLGAAFGDFSTELSTGFVRIPKPPARALI